MDMATNARWVSWNKGIATATLALLVCLVSGNLLIDPFEVFGLMQLTSTEASNERFNKMEYLLKNRAFEHYDSYIVGSSRMEVFDPRIANELRPTQRFYNLSVMGGSHVDAQEMLSTLKANGAPIREILYGIDLFPFWGQEKNTLNLKPHPTISGESWGKFYLQYAIAPSWSPIVKKIAAQFRPTPSVRFDFQNTGRYWLPKYDEEIAKDAIAFEARMFPKVLDVKAEINWKAERFIQLGAFLSWAAHNKINVTLFVHPYNKSEVAYLSDTTYLEFFERLTQVTTSAVDFSNVLDITTRNSLFYDRKHYRPIVAEWLLRCLYKQTCDSATLVPQR